VKLYLTQDRISTPTGGGVVTHHESVALLGFSEVPGEGAIVDRKSIEGVPATPFEDDEAYERLVVTLPKVRLAHIYAGCFTKTVYSLKRAGAKISYTAAAHDIKESRREFEELGIPFSFPHLTDPTLWARYVGGYLDADLVICPSTLSKKCMESYGAKNVIVIPHGCEAPKRTDPFPKKFTLGYLGQVGPDKGLRYLFEAWKRLNMKDATLLIAGRNIEQALPLWRKFGGGNVFFMGFVDDVSDFYNAISAYVQPSVTEGFGIEIIEAAAHGRPVVASDGAGASELIREGSKVVPRRDVIALADAIEDLRANQIRPEPYILPWESVRQKYVAAWKDLLK
jgi:glycosyltransferase involved in cell wall biosynthesis